MATSKKSPQNARALRKSNQGQTKADTEARLKAVLDHVLDGIVTIDDEGVVESFNSAAERIFGYPASEVIGQNVKMLMPEPYHGEHDGYLRNYLDSGKAKIIGIGREVLGLHKDGTTFPLNLGVSEMRVGGQRKFVGMLRDISEQKEAERTIAEQHRNLLELSTPVLKVWDEVVLLPLIGTIDTERAAQIIDSLLQAIVSTEARVAVIDVTGVGSIDTYTAQHLIKTVSAAEMLGAEVLITGISPVISQTLVKLGVDLSAVRACGPLRAGISEALRLTGGAIFGRTDIEASPAEGNQP